MGRDIALTLGLMRRGLLGLKGRYLERRFNKQVQSSRGISETTISRVQIDALEPLLVLIH